MADLGGVDTSIYPKAEPNALFNTAQQAVGVQNALVQNAQGLQDLRRQQVGSLIDAFSSLATNPNVGYGDFVRLGQTLLQQGVIDPNTYKQEIGNVPQGAPPEVYQQIANGYLARALDAGQRFGVEFGYSPGQGATLQQLPAVGANGQPTGATANVPTSVVARTLGGGTAAPVPTEASATGAGLREVGAAAPAAAHASSPGFSATTATPQQQAQFQASAAQQQGDLQSDANYIQNVTPLRKIIDILPKTPLFGEGAQWPTQLAAVLNTYGIDIGADQASNSKELEKYMTQLARGSGAASNTNDQLAAAFAANPNMTMTKASAQDVAKVLLSLQRMQHAKVLASQAQQIAPEQYSQWSSSQWQQNQDPRAYGFDLMDDQAKAALKKELGANPSEAKRFINSYNTARQLGILGNSSQ